MNTKQIAEEFWKEYFYMTTDNPDKDTFIAFCENLIDANNQDCGQCCNWRASHLNTLLAVCEELNLVTNKTFCCNRFEKK